jgi:hypothetical protein
MIIIAVVFFSFDISKGMDPCWKEGTILTETQIMNILNNHYKWLSYNRSVEDYPLKACFSGADLQNTNFMSLDLREADFYLADLQGAYFTNSDLEGSIFAAANLKNVDMVDTNLRESNFSRADIENVVFDVSPDKLPIISRIAEAYNLDKLTYESSPAGLYALRKEFKENGYRRQEREITFSIKHNERIKSYNWLENKITYILFELPSGWGMHPLRPLVAMVGLIPIFSIIYMIFICRNGKDGIWIKWDDARLRKELGTSEPQIISKKNGNILDCFVYSLYFSLLSAFHIGWKELNVGAWINRMKIKEYSLMPTGSVRFLSGIQSLISSYMLALSILTYFGRPFE